ncbi:hypothetical protein BDN70DRAFT_232209 [Pholiota conissans]|uniref:MYND-type domain-containing protein n=1 Tax=Pholiota conissans TaxID=109636 RepID=A0A9P5YVU0_9AGAR|nr:hypothetical protein BDN70DRAFT_232209 [Pholiota conissans]
MAKSESEPKLSKPHLPPEFIQRIESDPKMKGAKTRIYSSEVHDQRLRIHRWNNPISPNIFTILPNGSEGFTEESKRTLIHLYAMEGDILALCELIRCGADPDWKDTLGVTPIFVALADMVAFLVPGLVVVKNGKRCNKSDMERDLYKSEQVIRILVEQHADVNTVTEGLSHLYLACVMRHWGLINLFLEHGATNTVPDSLIEKLFAPSDQARFYALVKAKANQERPPRVCPCWSGKFLKDCHAKEQSYPLKFVCVCGSDKVYEKCCFRRRPVLEKWDDAHGRIVQYFSGQVFPSTNDREVRIEANSYVAGLVEPFIDPAFAYALKRSPFHPIPCGSKYSRKIHEECQRCWNALIDEYIALGTDKRSTFDIERAAKIGVRAGALIRTCEGEGCSKVERKDIDALKNCAKCHIAVYCSPACQKSAWPTHKKVCCTADQKNQALPSQHFMQEFHKEYLATSPLP